MNKIANRSQPIKRATFDLKKLSADDDFKAEYEFWLKNEREKYLHEKTGFLEGKAEGVAEGMAKGRVEGILEGQIKAVINLMQEMNLSLEKAMSVLKIDDAYKDEIKAQLANMQEKK